MVERILQNLLTNAIKYSVGTIKITLMEKENNNIIFTIENPMSDSSEIDCNDFLTVLYRTINQDIMEVQDWDLQ